jgi:hypothetical protein
MLPEMMGPAEIPEDFLPDEFADDELDGMTLAEYKARSGEPFRKNRIVAQKIIPRLGIEEEDEEKTANKLSRRDQEWRTRRGIFLANFAISRKAKGKEESKVPDQVEKVASRHNEEQWLHVWRSIDYYR